MPRDTPLPPPVLPLSPYPDVEEVLSGLIADADLSEKDRAAIAARATDLVEAIRAETQPGLMEVFLAEYGLSTDEGIALMCLAEALLRVPDAATMDELIEDKIAPGRWSEHLGQSSSPLVNASTWALMFTGRVLDDDDTKPLAALRGAIKRLGEPVIRRATLQAMREMGRQFVLGEDIEDALKRATRMQEQGYTYSYDMLGEAALTEADAQRYHDAYTHAICTMARAANHAEIDRNPGISVKLSALHPRYEMRQRERVLEELTPRLAELALLAAEKGIGLNVDAEEQDRLTLSLEIIERVLEDPRLKDWAGFGVVVQAYGPRAGAVIDWLEATAERLDRRLMVRLVKGAYWDTEIKRAQQDGLASFPVFARKPATDVSYIACARRLLKAERIYPQFGTHNAHTVAAVLHMAEQMGIGAEAYEFQKLHGMGGALYDIAMEHFGIRCRIYAPVGKHRDLLAYLVRRLLENGANSSFVNQIVDEDVPAEKVGADPFAAIGHDPVVAPGTELWQPERANARGWDLAAPEHLAEIEAARAPFRATRFEGGPLLAGEAAPEPAHEVLSPSNPADLVGHARFASTADVETAFAAAQPWDVAAEERARILNAVADAYEAEFGRIFALLAREAGKTLDDSVAEIREAVDFLRYYAAQKVDAPPLGRVVCISPWNFPLAIFTGQIAAALMAGNAVLAKPAPQTTLIAALAVDLMHGAGVPRSALQLLPGASEVGAALTSDARVDGAAFTGSHPTAKRIQAALAEHAAPGTPLIAETGGLNAMIVDSTALPEQAVKDVVESAFQSAGQRCSACRCLYVQTDIYESFLEMLKGAMDAFRVGDPWFLDADSGPLIDAAAHEQIAGYVEGKRAEGKLLHQITAPEGGHFLAPTLIAVDGIGEIEREVFGPVLHVARYRAADLEKVIGAINATGYGLTFGLHTRIDDRVEFVTERVHAGNVYVNRNQIGAIVGSQPFGGEGLSGTGPKAGGPHYLPRFCQPVEPALPASPVDLPGPTGEANRLRLVPRPPVLCLGPDEADRAEQVRQVERLGGVAQPVEELPDLRTAEPFGAAIWWGDAKTGRTLARQLVERDGPILGLVTGAVAVADVLHERHLCIDTTASGGNAQLLAQAATDDPAG